jgi:undecaprenyl-diphosphatase
MKLKHRTRNIIFGIITLLLIALAIAFPTLRNNIHTVIPGEVYRSAQLSPQKLEGLVKQYHIKTVINLEGQSDNPWFLKEKQTLDDNHVQLYNIGLPAKGLPPVQRFKRLIQVLLTAPMPILIHCKNGADRTGLASAIALILYQQADLSTAKQQIAWWYGAVSPSSTGRVVIPMYEAWLTQNHLEHSRANFLIWTDQVKVMRPYQAHHHITRAVGPSVLHDARSNVA